MIKESIEYKGIDYIIDPDINYINDIIEFNIMTTKTFGFKFNFEHNLKKNYGKQGKNQIRFDYNEFLFNFIKNMMDKKSQRFLDNKNLKIGQIPFTVITSEDLDGEIEEIQFGINILKYDKFNFKFKWYAKISLIDELINQGENLKITDDIIEKFMIESELMELIKNKFNKFTEIFMKDHMSMYIKMQKELNKNVKRPIAFYTEKSLEENDYQTALNILDTIEEDL